MCRLCRSIPCGDLRYGAQCRLEPQARRKNTGRNDEDRLSRRGVGDCLFAVLPAWLTSFFAQAARLKIFLLLRRECLPFAQNCTPATTIHRKLENPCTIPWHARCSLFLPMATGLLNTAPPAPARMRYASTLRCFGQFLDGMELKALEVKTTTMTTSCRRGTRAHRWRWI